MNAELRTVANEEFELVVVNNEAEIPNWTDLSGLVEFFHHTMKPYHDSAPDVRKGLLHAMGTGQLSRGFLVLARCRASGKLVGGLTMLDTGMGGFVPENLLLFVAVDPTLRGKGLGKQIIDLAISKANGAVKLHVEKENPARRLYNRLGFTEKYVEMRFAR